MGYFYSMNGAVFAFGIAAFALSVGATTPSAHAQAGDRCHNYATQMISMDQRARQIRCANWTSHSNYDGHYKWCQARPPASAQTALSAWGTRFQTCQFASSGSPAARSTLNDCQAFTNFAMNIHARYAQAACPRRNYMHNNRNNHYNWCVSKTPAQVAADRNLKQRGLDACLSGRPVP